MQDDPRRSVRAHVQQRHQLDLSRECAAAGFTLPVTISVHAWLACGSPRPDLDWPGAGVLSEDILAALRNQITRATPRMLSERVLPFGFLPDYDAEMVELLCVYDDRHTTAQLLLLAPVPVAM